MAHSYDDPTDKEALKTYPYGFQAIKHKTTPEEYERAPTEELKVPQPAPATVPDVPSVQPPYVVRKDRPVGHGRFQRTQVDPQSFAERSKKIEQDLLKAIEMLGKTASIPKGAYEKLEKIAQGLRSTLRQPPYSDISLAKRGLPLTPSQIQQEKEAPIEEIGPQARRTKELEVPSDPYVAIEDPKRFDEFVKSLNLPKDIATIKSEFSVGHNLPESEQRWEDWQEDIGNDMLRLKFEAYPPGNARAEEEARKNRRAYGPRNVLTFYQSLAKGAPAFSKVAAIYRISRVMDSMDDCPEIKAALGRIAANLVDSGFVTTKGDAPLGKLFEESKGDLEDFRRKITKMSMSDPQDGYKDKLIKRVYEAFVRDLDKASVDTPSEMHKTTKDATVLIDKIRRSAEAADTLNEMVKRYERAH